MTRDEQIEVAKKIDDLTKDLSNEDYSGVMRISQGLRPPRQIVQKVEDTKDTKPKV